MRLAVDAAFGQDDTEVVPGGRVGGGRLQSVAQQALGLAQAPERETGIGHGAQQRRVHARSARGLEVAVERQLRLARGEQPVADDGGVDTLALGGARGGEQVAGGGARDGAVAEGPGGAAREGQGGDEGQGAHQKPTPPESVSAMPWIDGPIRMIRSGGTQNIIVPTVSLVGSTFAFSSARITRLSRISAA